MQELAAESVVKYLEPTKFDHATGAEIHQSSEALLIMADMIKDQITRGIETRPEALKLIFKASRTAYRMMQDKSQDRLESAYFENEVEKYQALEDSMDGKTDSLHAGAFCVGMSRKSLKQMASDMKNFPIMTVFKDEGKTLASPAIQTPETEAILSFYVGTHYMTDVSDEQMIANEQLKTTSWRNMAKEFVS